MYQVVQAEIALKEFTLVQQKLCAALFQKHGLADKYLTNIPPSGLVKLDSEVWDFKKHGVGVCFERLSDRLVIDVHRYIESCPACVDPWRLVQYLESKNIRQLNVGSRVFDAEDEEALNALLEELSRAGRAARHNEAQAFLLK
jgi:hypothetical protein